MFLTGVEGVKLITSVVVVAQKHNESIVRVCWGPFRTRTSWCDHRQFASDTQTAAEGWFFFFKRSFRVSNTVCSDYQTWTHAVLENRMNPSPCVINHFMFLKNCVIERAIKVLKNTFDLKKIYVFNGKGGDIASASKL